MAELLYSVGGFIVAIGVLVTFHEFGHFWVARRCGVRVLRFSVGFGRPLLRWHGADGCEFVIAAIPLGGYVRMLDEREDPVPPELAEQAFNRRPLAQRVAIVAAGPAFNLLLAVLLYWGVFVTGVEGLRPLVAEPPAGSLAAEAGVRAGDEVLAVNGEATPTWQVLRTELIDAALGGQAPRLVLRGSDGSVRELRLPRVPTRVEPDALFAELGLSPWRPPLEPVLDQVLPDSPAARAGFRSGDRLLAVNGEQPGDWEAWARWFRAHPGVVARIEFERAGERMTRELIIGSRVVDGAPVGWFGATVTVPEDLWQDLRAEFRLGPLEAVPAAIERTSAMSVLTLRMLWRMVTGDVSVRNISGPIQIAQYAGYSASIGLSAFLGFLAIVSISLGVLNLLPIPVLDGGHLLYYLIEWLRGRPLSEQAQLAGQQAGLLLLALLMFLALYNDLTRLLD